jgi:signal transduction histidine kinase
VEHRGGPPGLVIVLEPTRPRVGIGVGQLEMLMLPIQLLLAAVAGLILLQTLVRPLRAMERFATRVAGGDFDARLGDDSKDELGRLSRQLDLMATRLSDARDDVAETEQQRRQLFADITHELATPLTSIRGYAATLRDPRVSVSDAERTRYLLGIHEEAERLARLVRDLFELARLEAGAAPLEREPIEWSGLCGNTVDRFRKPFHDAGLALSWRPPPLDCWILADGHRIVQVLENLLGNALRYVPPGGAVRVTLTPATDGDGRHRLRVLDDGPGVPAADLPHLFERFYRGDATRGGDGRRASSSAGADGTGLGLAIAREIVLGHGGTARAQRREPHGLAVVVELPACAAPICQGNATPLPTVPGTAEQEVTL